MKPASREFVQYNGDFGSLFKIYIVNVLLTIVTLGFYYPWAKVKLLRYHYGETQMNGSPFVFHGTGKEVFRGFIKALLIFGAWYAVFFAISFYGESGGDPFLFIFGILIWELVLVLIIPLALVGSLKYRLSRSSWRGIHLSYSGTVKSMYKVMIKGVLLSIVTLGFYLPWFYVAIRKEILKNTKFGNVSFDFKGKGGDLIMVMFVGGLLSVLTLYIYTFQFQANVMNFYIDNIHIKKGEEKASFYGTISGWGLFKLWTGNLLIVLITLGLGAPYALIRTMKFYTKNFQIEGSIDFDSIEQGELIEADATGDSFLDAFEMDII